MRINMTPIPTCQNYLINDFDIKENLIPEFIKTCDLCDNAQINIDEKCSKLLQIKENYTKVVDLLDGDNKRLDFSFDNSCDQLVENIKFNVADFSHCSVTISYFAKSQFFHNGLLDFSVGKGCHMSVVILSDVSAVDSLDLLSIKCNLGEGSTLSLSVVDLSKGTTMSKRLEIDTPHDDSIVNISTICLAESASVDYNYITRVLGERNVVDMKSVGALSHTDKHFKGCIDFKRGSRKSVGKEKEVCLILDDESKSLSLPTILCEEEDVDISHATATAKLSDKAMFYMNSRGIDEKEAGKIYLISLLSSLMIDLDDKVKEKILDKAGRMMYEN